MDNSERILNAFARQYYYRLFQTFLAALFGGMYFNSWTASLAIYFTLLALRSIE